MKKNFKKIISLVLTVLMLVGTFSAIIPMTASADEITYPYELKKNETAVAPNGVTYRFDTDTSINPDSKAWLNEDGTFEIKYRSGDILWFPNVELTETSSVRMDVTNTSGVGQTKIVAGIAYAITRTESGRADTMVNILTHTGGRLRYANSSFTSNNTPVPGDGFNGQGGTSEKETRFDTQYVEQWQNNKAWKDVTDSSKCIANGKTVTYGVFKKDSGEIDAYYGGHYSIFNDKYMGRDKYAWGSGSVGYTAVYSYDESYAQSRISDLMVKNCKVNGEAVSAYSIFGEVIEPHTNVEVNGKIYRFDPIDEHTESYAVLKADGTFRVTLQSGDLFWMPEVKNIDTAVLTAKMITNNNQYDNGNLAAGLAYSINAGENGVWGDDADSLINAHTQTSWRRRIASQTAADRNVFSSPLGVQSTHSIKEEDRNDAYLAWGDRWTGGKITKYSASINDEGNLYVSFMDKNNVQMTYDYYAIDEDAGKVFNGPVGFYAVWDGDNNDHGYMTVEILELDGIKEEAPVYGVTNAEINLSLEGTIGLNFSFTADEGVPANAEVVATKAGEVIDTQAVVMGDNAITVPVAAKEMNDEVNFSIMVDGEVFAENSYTYTVAEYAAELLADDEYADWADLINAMLDYGAAAQIYFDYKTDALDADLSDVAYAFETVEAGSYTGDINAYAPFVSLVFGSEAAVVVYLKAEEMPVVTLMGEEIAVVDNGNGYYAVTIDGIAAEAIADQFVIVINGEVSITYSALNAAASLAEKTENADAVVLANAFAVYAQEAALKN